MQTITQKWASRHDDDSGFTLIELLVVIVIIGILSAVVVFSVAGISDRGEEASCEADEQTVTVAEEAYYAEHGSYASEADLVSGGFLEDESDLHNVTVSGNDFTVTAVAGSACA